MPTLNTGGLINQTTMVKAIKEKLWTFDISGITSLAYLKLPKTARISDIIIKTPTGVVANTTINISAKLSNAHTTHSYPTRAITNAMRTSATYLALHNVSYYTPSPVLDSLTNVWLNAVYLGHSQYGTTSNAITQYLFTYADEIGVGSGTATNPFPDGSILELWGEWVDDLNVLDKE